MAANRFLARRLTYGMVLLLVLLFGSNARADIYVMSDQHDGCICIPNAGNFGYFETKWREWPGQPRPEKTNPRAIHAEQLPTPPGTPQMPMPEPRTTPGGGPRLPTGITPARPREGGILPPGMDIQIEGARPEAPAEPLQPLEPGLPPLPPLQRPQPGGLPPLQGPQPGGLPPLPPQPLVPQPPQPPVEEGLPALPLPSETPFQLEPFPGGNPPGLQENRNRLPGLVPGPGDGGSMGRPSGYPSGIREGVGERTSYAQASPLPARGGVSSADWRQEVHPLRSSTPGSTGSQNPWDPSARQVIYQDPVEPWAQPLPGRPGQSAAGPAASRAVRSQRPSNQPPGLRGYCPVQLVENERWLSGDPRWTAIHRGRTYVFSGPEQQRRFQANPVRYAPVLSGTDPVLAVDYKRTEPGTTDFCVVYDGRLFMFSSASTLARFRQNPTRYTAVARRATF